MSNQFRKRLLQTQPQHESFTFDSDSTLLNKSEASLRPASRPKDAEVARCWMRQRSANKSNPSSPSRTNSRRRLDINSVRRKYRQACVPHAKPQAPQLYSPFIGLKVRRAVQADFEFHSTFTRDEVIKYFAMPAGSNIKKRAARNEEELRREQPVKRVQAREQQQVRLASKGEQRLSSQLSGWKVQSDCVMRQSSLDGQSYQIISNYPSINAGFTQDVTDSLPLGRSQASSTEGEDCPASDFELPQYSLKIVPPSELNSSVKEMISIRVINENLPSCSLVENSCSQVAHSKNPISCAKVYSKASLNPRSELKVSSSKYSALRSKQSYDSLPSNKENHCQKEKEQQPSIKEVKLQSKGQLRGILDSGKISVSYSEDYVCSQKLDENDGLRVTEREETRAFKFERSNKPTPAISPPVPPAVPPEVCMKKEKERKSVVIEKIEEFGSNCKNFFSSLADKINPFREKIVEEDSDLGESILALRTLNSRVDLDLHCSPREMQVCIREPTMLGTQPWGVDSMQERVDPLLQRMGTQHEVRTTAKDFSSEVRIALTSHSQQREEFYSQEYLAAQTEETVRLALACASPREALNEVIAEQVERILKENSDLLVDLLCPRGVSREEIKDEVALSLEILEQQIMKRLLW